MRYVIIGNGVAGVTAADTIRQLDPEGRLTFIARETLPPYCRPMIALVLAGSADLEALPIREDDYYGRLGAEAHLGEQAVAIDTHAHTVTTDLQRTVPYDRLLIASGADPHRIDAQNQDLANIFYMRTQTDVDGMLAAMPEVEHALVLGGGLVGFKAAYGFLSRGKRVTMVIRSGHPLALQADETAGGMIQEELERHGLTVLTGVEASAFEGDAGGRVKGASLSDGSGLTCDAVVIGKGVFPAHSFVPEEVTRDAGIVVDECLRTTAPDVWAAGDVAEHIDVARKKPWVNALWPVAVEMGRVAGFNMAGRAVPYPGSLSRNVIRIFDLDILTTGIVSPRETAGLETLSHHDRRRNTYRTLYFREGVLVGAVLVNDIEQGGVLMNLIQTGRQLDGARDLALGPTFNVAQVIGTTR